MTMALTTEIKDTAKYREEPKISCDRKTACKFNDGKGGCTAPKIHLNKVGCCTLDWNTKVEP